MLKKQKLHKRYRTTILTFIICLYILICLMACGIKAESDTEDNNHISYSGRTVLNERQREILVQMELPTEYDKLSASQQLAIQRIESMLTYLEDKYEPSFEYAGYIPASLDDEEELIAYQKNPDGSNKRLISVKVDKSGNYYDDFEWFVVGDYYAELWEENFKNNYPDLNYRFYYTPLRCDMSLNQIENNDFKWAYAVNNLIIVELNEYDISRIKKIAVKLTLWYYEHQVDGTTHIRIFNTLPTNMNSSNYKEWFDENIYLGFYDFGFEPQKAYIRYSYKNIKTNEYVVDEDLIADYISQ